MYKNSETSYGSISRFFHWTIALLMLVLLIGGYMTSTIPRNTDTAHQLRLLYSMHNTMGVTVLFLSVLRIVWGLTQVRPAPLHPERRLETLASEVTHYALYVSLILVPITGWILNSSKAGAAPVLIPFVDDLPFIPKSDAWLSVALRLHVVSALGCVILLLAHIGGALKHAVFDHDGTMARMLRGRAFGAPVSHGKWHHLPHALAAVGWAVVATGAVFLMKPDGLTVSFADRPSLLVPAASAAPEQDTWEPIEGRLAITTVKLGEEIRGGFQDWAAQVRYDEVTGEGTATVIINTRSVQMGTVSQEVQSFDFFHTDTFGEAIFEAQISRVDGDTHIAEGTLTLIGKPVPVAFEFDLKIDGDIATMSGATVLDRRDFGMGWRYPDESKVGFMVPVSIALTARKPS